MLQCFPGGASGKELDCQCKRDVGSIPGSERPSGEGHGNPLQYSCLENPMDRGAWWARVHRVAKSRTQLKQLSMQPFSRVGEWLFKRLWFLSYAKEMKWKALSCVWFLRPHGLEYTRLLCPWDPPGKNTGVGCHFLLQGIFPIQESNRSLLHYRQILYWLSYEGSPHMIWGKTLLFFLQLTWLLLEIEKVFTLEYLLCALSIVFCLTIWSGETRDKVNLFSEPTIVQVIS